jgi:hypothetical protein
VINNPSDCSISLTEPVPVRLRLPVGCRPYAMASGLRRAEATYWVWWPVTLSLPRRGWDHQGAHDTAAGGLALPIGDITHTDRLGARPSKSFPIPNCLPSRDGKRVFDQPHGPPICHLEMGNEYSISCKDLQLAGAARGLITYPLVERTSV